MMERNQGADVGISAEDKDRDQDVRSQIGEYLETTYGEIDYTVSGIVYAGWNQGYDEMTAKVNGTDPGDGIFKVRRYETETGISFKDTYAGWIIRPQLEAQVFQEAQAYFGDCLVFADSNQLWLGDGDALSSLEEAIDSGKRLDCSVWILTDSERMPDGNFDESVESFSENWTKEMPLAFSIYLLRDGAAEKVTRENCYDIAGDDIVEYKVFLPEKN